MEEDQAATDHTAHITGQLLSSSLQMKQIEDVVYDVAPGEDNMPNYVSMDDDFGVLALTDLFATGTEVLTQPYKTY